MALKNEKLIQYIIDTSDVVLEKKQEATEYLNRFVDLEIQSRKVIVEIANSDLQIEEEQINAEKICNDWIDTFGKEAE